MVLFLSGGSPEDEQDEFFEETDKRSQVEALRGELRKKLGEKKFTKAYRILKVCIHYVHTVNKTCETGSEELKTYSSIWL